ncbi:hypothetical protein [Sphingobacterium suaedae]|uniref:Uncharacterized protein n=1 Tax=Sphingobacterium suaedae TaxID=1686402 RepID=A0ABW5KC34_9SPHI
MFFIYTIYDYVLGEKEISATLKDDMETKPYTLQIVTQARRFLGLPFGGGLVKMSRVYDVRGNLINTTRYSKDLKATIKAFKKECPIPFFKLWKGFVFVAAAVAISSLIFSIKTNIERNNSQEKIAHTVEKLTHIKTGQLYAVSYFANVDGQSINGLPEGWLRVVQVVGDTIFAQRSKQKIDASPLFAIDKLLPILPQTEEEWEPAIERFDYQILRSHIENPSPRGRFDLLYVEPDRKKYDGVVLTIHEALSMP